MSRIWSSMSRPKKKPARPASPPPTPARPADDDAPAPAIDALIAALLASDEPIADVARRLGVTRQYAHHTYRRLQDEGYDVPERRHRGRPMNPPVGAADSSPEAEPATIGERIAAYRAARGISQKALGRLMDPPAFQPAINAAEHAGDAVARPMVVRIARALGIDPCDLDVSLAPARSISLARVDSPGMGVGWEPLRTADRARMDELWEGDGPGSENLGELADRAAADGIAVVLRGDLPVKADEGGE